MYVTNTGTIGIFLMTMKENVLHFLKNVEMALDKAVLPIAGIHRTEFRNSWKKENISTGLMRKAADSSAGFVDLDFLEYLQRLDPRIMQQVVDHAVSPQSVMNSFPRDLQGVIGMVESLKHYY